MDPLARLRLQLTAWYAGVLTLVLALLGAGLFVAVRHQMSERLDASLRAAAGALEQAARIRETEQRGARGTVVDAVDELHIPERSLYLLDDAFRAIKPAVAPAWLLDGMRRAGGAGRGYADLDTPDAHELRVYTERFTGSAGAPYVAGVLADRGELEDEYRALIEAFAIATLAALLLVAGGGYLLVRKSTAPIERSMEQMRRFMGDAAHELRTPLAVLRTQADVALGRPRDAAGDASAFQAMEREAAQLGRIVGDLLTLARADAGERPIASETVYLDDVAAEAVNAVRSLADPKRIELQVGAFDEAKLTADAALVRQLLLIVLDNAIKYTPAGGHVRLDVAARDGVASVVVADSGPGIAAEQLPFVFERFWRGEASRRQVEGAGLGLAIARWIADAHGARIDIASSPGQGTRVTITFPLAATD